MMIDFLILIMRKKIGLDLLLSATDLKLWT